MNTPPALDAGPSMSAHPQGLKALPRAVWVAGGVALLTIAGLASALVLERRTPSPQAEQAVADPPPAPAKNDATAPKQARAEDAGGNKRYIETRDQPPVADVCRNCGVIESVQAVQHKGEGTGLGAVTGGVVGGLLGNQVGKGNGRKAMTVVGAVGGGFAGHEIEKRARSVTVYKVRVRMDDGSLRTVTQKQAPAVGQRVTVQGHKLRAAEVSQGTAPAAPRTWKTDAPADSAGS
ncbi:glycine zipper 2TM domain-containing protein [Aquabacterium sp. A7-Y]|uniref:glycine zipper 2TM domain-containing protein n=1 Tax=Aquabacterium sp. A7-Y TaxID=1349605 RepID=UPI00223DD94A|nr:glycine zipper 2TM domain-containing protein [Aquabacterium sp. A7-Y]MCW7539362.1 glycine zipper 2TM domain-containing protein [Aquabacterium sp. A7-Y]